MSGRGQPPGDLVGAGWEGHATRVRRLVEPETSGPLPPYGDFAVAAEQVLALLSRRLPLAAWMVTRRQGDRLVVAHLVGEGYAFRVGDTFLWSKTLCSRMVEERAPRVAPRAAQVPGYRRAAVALGIDVGAYVGVPLVQDGGSLFGTVCGIDPAPHDDTLLVEAPVVELCGRLLSAVLAAEQRVEAQARRAERAEVDAFTDPLTGLVNRRAWERLLAAEEARCRRHGRNACVVSVDIDGLKDVNDAQGHPAGDLLLVATARALEQTTREQDVVARLGGDEFAILCVECDLAEAQVLLDRLRRALEARGVSASLGVACRADHGDLTRAVEAADLSMYAHKRGRRG